MAINYVKGDHRLFEEKANLNNRYYRESETHAKVHLANERLREDFGFEKRIYEELHDANQTYQEI